MSRDRARKLEEHRFDSPRPRALTRYGPRNTNMCTHTSNYSNTLTYTIHNSLHAKTLNNPKFYLKTHITIRLKINHRHIATYIHTKFIKMETSLMIYIQKKSSFGHIVLWLIKTLNLMTPEKYIGMEWLNNLYT